MSELSLKDLYFKFRDPNTIKVLSKEIHRLAKDLDEPMSCLLYTSPSPRD
jgi:hydrogenase expression/formation protein HypD